MPIICPTLQACYVHITVKYADGRPASFASVDVYEVRRFLWWEYDAWVASKTADFYGRVWFYLTKGRKYHFRFRAVDKRGDVWRTIDYCPFYMATWFP